MAPEHLVIGTLLVECLLWLSDHIGWPAWHKGYAVLTAVATVVVATLVILDWFAISLTFHGRFQFGVRSLFVLVVVIAIPCSWFSAAMEEAKQQRKTVAAIEELGAETWEKPSGPEWLRDLLGDDFLKNVDAVIFHGSEVTDAGLEHLKTLRQLKNLNLGTTRTTDAGLEHIKALRQLQVLNLNFTRVSDAGLESLKRLTELQELRLDDTKVTDAGLRHLEGLSQLTVLWLDGTQVTDAGLEHLRKLSQLEDLGLRGTKVTREGVQALQQLLPQCEISVSFR